MVQEASPSGRSFEEVVDLGLQENAHRRSAIAASVQSVAVTECAQRVRHRPGQRCLVLLRRRVARAGCRQAPTWLAAAVTRRRHGNRYRNVSETRQTRRDGVGVVDGRRVLRQNRTVVRRRRSPSRSPGHQTEVHVILRCHDDDFAARYGRVSVTMTTDQQPPQHVRRVASSQILREEGISLRRRKDSRIDSVLFSLHSSQESY